MRAANLSASRSGTTKPVRPSTIASGMPLWSDPIAGSASAAASRDHGRQPLGVAVARGEAGDGEQPGATHPVGDFVLGERAGEVDDVGKAKLAAKALQRGSLRSVADDLQPCPRMERSRLRQSKEQQPCALLLDQPADMKDESGFGVAAVRTEAIEVDAEIVGVGALFRVADGHGLAPDRVRDGEEQVALRHQPSPEQRIFHPGDSARGQQPPARATDVIAVQGW